MGVSSDRGAHVRVKSHPHPADLKGMEATLAFIIGPADLWLAIVVIAAWLAIICLKTIACDIERTLGMRRLQSEVKNLKAKQVERLQAANSQR